MLEIIIPLLVIFIAIGLIFVLNRKYSNELALFNGRFLILLTGVLVAIWWLKTLNYFWLILSILLLGLGMKVDQKFRIFSSKKYFPHPSMQNLNSKQMRVRISSIDYAPEDLYSQTPFEADIIRCISGPDRPDYWLAELTKPLRWAQNGNEKTVSHLVLAMRHVGEQMTRGIKERAIGIAYVTDQSLLEDNKLTFDKCNYVAIGIVDDISSAA